MAKVSVIMPSLNVALYIRECMDSVLSQTLGDIELVCVDAGSTDGTWEILKEYASGDERVRLIRSDQRSYGYQMNLGIRESVGEYIGIVETDDLVGPGMYESLYAIAKEHDADIVKSDFDIFTESNDGARLGVTYSLHRMNRLDYGKVYSCDDYINERIKPECYIWNAIYKREFLTGNGVRFNESPGACFQDFSFRYQTCYQADRIIATDSIGYQYRRGNTGASTYNPELVGYNLRETGYVLDVFGQRGLLNDRTGRALVAEITEFAFWPYMDMLKWSEASKDTEASYAGYRKLFKEFIDKGWLGMETVNPDLWMSVDLLLEGTDIYMGYAKVVAGIEREKIEKYLTTVRAHKDVIIYGSGVRGKAIYVFLKNSGMDNIRAVCDGNASRQGEEMYGTKIISPEQAAGTYRDALFILSSPANEGDMRDTLGRLGIRDGQISPYPLSVHPLFCTNCMARDHMNTITNR